MFWLRTNPQSFLVGALVNSDKLTVPYVRAQESKRAAETLENMKSILLQVRAEADNPEVIVKVHSDGAKVVDALHKDAVWNTISAACEPESNGMAERQVQAIKERATSMILHADMPRSFWSYAVRQGAYELWLEALGVASRRL